jgi:hypothetical protein
MKIFEGIDAESNIELIVRERGKIVQREQSHNIVTNIGRQMMAEVIAASAFPTSTTFTRTSDRIVRYIGFGMGGDRQTSPFATAAPFSTDYPGTQLQTDTDLAISGLERPVAISGTINTPGVPDPAVWLKEIAAPATFPSATTVRFIALFTPTDINFGTYASVPLSEIGMFSFSSSLGKSDPVEPNGQGSAGTYPGAGGHIVSYDTFNTIHKTGLFSIEVRWEYRF